MFCGRFSKGSLDDFKWFSIKEAANVVNWSIGFGLKGKAITRKGYRDGSFDPTILGSQSQSWIVLIVIKMLVFLCGFESFKVFSVEVLCKKGVVHKFIEVTN